MFERYSILGLMLAFNIGILIWQVSIQKMPTNVDVKLLPIDNDTAGARPSHEKQQNEISLKYYGTHRKTQKLKDSNTIDVALKTTAILRTSTTSIATINSSATTATIERTATIAPAPPSQAHQLPVSDYTQLIDLHDFDYLMSQPACNEHIEALIVVHSAPDNQLKRNIIRETFGGVLHNTPLRLIFMLAADLLKPAMQLNLTTENELYGDMVQGNFNDSYRNITYKHVMAFKWFLYNCTNAQLLIKIDDDVFVNTPLLLKYLHNAASMQTSSNSSNSSLNAQTPSSNTNFNASHDLFRRPQNLLFCQLAPHAKVHRSHRSKWVTKFKEYRKKYFPPYCPGYAIIYSKDVVLRLYKAAQNSNYLWIDDVLITGILAKETNTSITTLTPYLLQPKTYERLLAGTANATEKEFLFNFIKVKNVWNIWRLLKNSTVSRLPEASDFT